MTSRHFTNANATFYVRHSPDHDLSAKQRQPRVCGEWLLGKGAARGQQGGSRGHHWMACEAMVG
jgi:hypothetical protein